MNEQNFKLSALDGTFYKNENGCGVRFERDLNHPVEIVWQALTDPRLMEPWLAPATIEGRVGGTITLQMKGGKMGGRILQWKENELLEYEWHKGSVVRWELLKEINGRCRLIFIHHNPNPEVADDQLLGAATGWHYHMDAITTVLDGKKMPSFPMEAWETISREAAERYAARLKQLAH
jgi:uncharacterized protein YndB with AHSA1/START domain